MQLEGFFQYSRFKKKYLSLGREPFFEIARKYIGPTSKVVDIGSGEGEFLAYLTSRGVPEENVYLLDANEKTVQLNSAFCSHSLHYMAPQRLPFEDGSCDVLHMSHLIDNLVPGDLYSFLHEMNRVLKAGGLIVISTPLLWPLFYNDISHTRPYNPLVFYKYFVKVSKNARYDKIQGNYELKELVYRYFELPLDEGWSSVYPSVDFLMISIRRVLRILGFKRMQKNGYTIVLKKLNDQPL